MAPCVEKMGHGDAAPLAVRSRSSRAVVGLPSIEALETCGAAGGFTRLKPL